MKQPVYEDDPLPAHNPAKRALRWMLAILMAVCAYLAVGAMAKLKGGPDLPAMRTFLLSVFVFILSFSGFYLARES